MARKKQATTKSSDGKHRKETKEERRIRLEKQEEARQVSARGGDKKCQLLVVYVLI